jgi:hypothetical protein
MSLDTLPMSGGQGVASSNLASPTSIIPCWEALYAVTGESGTAGLSTFRGVTWDDLIAHGGREDHT